MVVRKKGGGSGERMREETRENERQGEGGKEKEGARESPSVN